MRRASKFAAASRLGLAVALALTTTGCGGGGSGGGGGGGGGGPGAVARVFPPQDGLSDDEAVVVRGTASSPGGIAGVTVVGVAATSNDGFATWTAAVPLALGANVLSTSATTGVGAVLTTDDVTVARVDLIPSALTGLAHDPTNGDVYLLEGAARRILRLVEATGEVTVVSSDEVGSGPSLASVAGPALDPQGGRAYVGFTNAGAGTVLSIELATGNRAVVTGPGVGSGAPLTSVGGVAFEAKGTLIAADFAAGTLVRIDRTTGARTLCSGGGVGTGPAFGPSCPRLVALDEAHGRAFAAGSDELFVVDLATGDRTHVSGNGLGTGPSLIPRSLCLDSDPASVLVARNAQSLELQRVDLATGDRAPLTLAAQSVPCLAPGALVLDAGAPRVLLTDPEHAALRAVSLPDLLCTDVWRPARGTGPQLGTPSAAALEDDGHVLFADRTLANALVRVNLATGDRTLLGFAVGPSLASDALGVTVDPVGGRALVTGSSAGKPTVVAFDLATGDRSLASDPAPAFGPIFDSPLGIATDGAHAWVANGGPAGVLRVDLATGLRTTVSDPLTGGGPAFTTVNGLAVDLVRGVAYVGAVDTTNDYGVFSVDLVTGDRAPVATAGFGSGPSVYAARTLRLASNGHVLSMGFRTLMDVDPDTNVRTAVSDAFVGHGPRFSPDASEIAGERSDGLVVVVDEGTAAVVVVDPVTGERLIVAR